MLAGLVKRAVGSLSDDGIRALVRFAFSRTQRALTAACADPRAAQTARLLEIVQRNANTEVGRALGFSSIASLDDWRARVPLTDWDHTAPYVERMVAGEANVLVDEQPIFYATTSGTTGRRKLIPVTSAFVGECRVANRVLYRTMLLAMPGLVRGKRLNMRSPATEALGKGAEAGSITVALSGGVDDDNLLDAVPTAVFSISDFHTRYAVAVRFALQERLTVCSSINPSTLQLFATTLATHADALAAGLSSGDFGVDVGAVPDDVRAKLQRRLKQNTAAAERLRNSVTAHGQARFIDVAPELCGLVTWKGGASSWWLPKLRASYGDVPVLDFGYAASEGVFGAPLSTSDASSVLLPHGHVIELLPEGETDGTRTLFLDDAEVGQRYEVVVTTSAGLYRYRMFDVVEIVGKHDKAPLAVFRHKAGTMCSITGEKLGEAHVATALHAVGFGGAGVVVAPHLPASGTPHYVVVVEEGVHIDPVALDAALAVANEEYDAKRKSLRLAPLTSVSVAHGSFAGIRQRRVAAGAPDAHVKLPLLSPDGRLVRDLGVDVASVSGVP
jgi:hypothetical protein